MLQFRFATLNLEWIVYMCIRTYVHVFLFVYFGFVVQVAPVLSELLENVLVNNTAPSLALASLIPSMLMVEWSTEAVQHLFKRFVQECATTVATPVSVYQNTLAIAWHTFSVMMPRYYESSLLCLTMATLHMCEGLTQCLSLLLARSKLLLSAHHCAPCFKWTCCHSSYWWTTVNPWTGFLSHSR